VRADTSSSLDYSLYMALEDLLALQHPQTDAHDELLFIVTHQAHEMWFKLLLHEFAELQRVLEQGKSGRALHTLHRTVAIVKTVVMQIGVLETMTARQFGRFRSQLSGSGFQSAQFREIEAVLGMRDRRTVQRYPQGSAERTRIESAMARASVFDSFIDHLSKRGYAVPLDRLRRDISLPLEPSAEMQQLLLAVYQDDDILAQLCERLTDLDEVVQEWRYRHVKVAERLIGTKEGTGGSSGATYLRGTLFRPVFPDLWAIRGEM
jgi:tryptophan 2,3-dioxygenase